MAGAAVVIAVGLVAYALGRGATPDPVVPAMANVGNVGSGLSGTAPDISQMSPLEQFTRLNDRVMQAAADGDTNTVVNFTPMALGAYALLDTVTVDARYHAAVLHAQIGNFAEALALADTILAGTPNNLFGYLIQGTVAQLQRDVPNAATAYRSFLDRFDAEVAKDRVEYRDHRNVLDQFRSAALSITQ